MSEVTATPKFTDSLTIRREFLAEGVIGPDDLREDVPRCALAWFVVSRGGSMAPRDPWAQTRRLFPDVMKRLGGRNPSVHWSRDVIEANNYSRGKEREAKLREIFERAGIRLKFLGKYRPTKGANDE